MNIVGEGDVLCIYFDEIWRENRKPASILYCNGRGREVYKYIKYASLKGHVYMEWGRGDNRQPSITLYDQGPQGRGRQL